MSSPFTDDVLARLSGFATAQFGLRFPPDRWHELGAGVASAALELAVSDLQDWVENLVAGKLGAEDVAAVGNHLTISETYFFRHPDTFRALEHEILPKRIAERRRQLKPLRIWSAGCASGEEPYSVAILLRHAFSQLREDSIVIRGTDLNTHVLRRATQGVYSEWSFRDAPPWLKSGYFKKTARGHYHEVSPEIRRLVRFSRLNLADALYPAEFGEQGDFDVILCRNVLMYFSAERQDQIIRRFTRALAVGGWLIVSPCDVTATEATELNLHSQAPGIYEKRQAVGRVNASLNDKPVPIAVSSPPAVESPATAAPSASAPRRRARPKVPGPATESREAPRVRESDLTSLARRHANRGELMEALAACDMAIAVDRLNPALHHLLGCVLLECNRLEEAEDSFRRVLYLNPDSVMAEFSLASLARRAGRMEEARHRYSVVLRLLAKHHRGDAVPDGDGVTVARLQDVVERTLNGDAR